MSNLHEMAALFDSRRLQLARTWCGMSKQCLAAEIGVTSSAVSQYELGQIRPQAGVLSRLALALGFPASFFVAGRPAVELSAVRAHFRSVRGTTQRKRDQARACVALVGEAARVIERYVELPPCAPLSEFSGMAPEEAAQRLRHAWETPAGPVADVVRLLESRGILVVYARRIGAEVGPLSAPVDPRPVVVLDPTQDKARARFAAAHELGHLVLHPESDPGPPAEEEADRFAEELLAPAPEIEPQLPRTASLQRYLHLKLHWGLPIERLLRRARRLGALSDAAYRRGVRTLVGTYGPDSEPAQLGPPEAPVLLSRALKLLEPHHITLARIADDLRLSEPFLRELLSLPQEAPRPHLTTADVLRLEPPAHSPATADKGEQANPS